MPTTEKMKLSGFSFSPRYISGSEYHHRAPYKGVFLGSTDGTNWYPIHYFDNVTVPELTTVSRTFENNTNDYYNHIALVAYEVGPNATGNVLNFAEMELFGLPEYDPDADGVDVKVTSYPNVPNTDWLEVYYDAKESSSYPGTGGTVLDLSGNQINGTLNGGVGFDSEYKAFTFDGTTTRNITTTLPSTVTGEYVHSVSLWVKAYEVSRSGSGVFTFFTIGSASSTNMIALGVNTSAAGDGLKYDFFNAGVEVKSPPITNNEWMHFVVTYSGGANNLPGAKRIYLNGKELVIDAYNGASVSSPLSLPTSPTLTIGGQINSSNPPFSGSIANFRLFNRALTSDEIYQLYAYQKEYFGHGDLSMTLKAGRLGIGTSEPKALLDVAGDERLQEYPPRALTGYSTHIEGHGVFGLHHTPGTGASGAVVNAFNKSATTA